MWDYNNFEELQKFLGTPPPFDKSLREIIDFLSLPPSYRSMSYYIKREIPTDVHDCIESLLKPLPHRVFCDKLRQLKPREFVSMVADLLEKLGGDIIPGAKGADGAIDLLWRAPEGDYIVQCKRWKNKVGEPTVREIYGAAMKCHAKGAFIVTASEFTDNAIWFITDLSLRVGLIDGRELFNLISLKMPAVENDIIEGHWKSHSSKS